MTGLKNEEEAEELSVDFQFWFGPLSSVAMSSPFGPSSRAEGNLPRPPLSPSIESFSTSGSTCDESDNSVLEDKWLCDFPNFSQVFPKQHDRK